MVTTKRKYIAFIPVRGGSVSIPLKNIKLMNGRPLVYWTIDAALACDYIEKVYVSTDSQEIKSIVQAYSNANVDITKLECIDRNASLATATASTEVAMLDFSRQHKFDSIVLIQATSPLLVSLDLTTAIEQYEENDCDSMLSVVRQKRFIWAEGKKGFEPQNYDYINRPRRQDFEGYLVENGAFYITSKKLLEKNQNRISGKIGVFEMCEESYYEIDEISDWCIVENILKVKQTEQKRIDMQIKLFVSDCDGVLTDGGMYYSETGDELKRFNTIDGMGFELLREKGIKTAIITGENSSIVKNRATKLKIDHICIGVADKLKVLKNILEKENLSMQEVAFIGDDINDVECIAKCGFGISVANGMQEVKAVADYITQRRGGDGAVREAINYILKFNTTVIKNR